MGKAEYEVMQTAWRERNPVVRIKSAHSALDLSPDCATAYILLAEEECTTVAEAERVLKQALKVAEGNYRKSQNMQHQGKKIIKLEGLNSNICIIVQKLIFRVSLK